MIGAPPRAVRELVVEQRRIKEVVSIRCSSRRTGSCALDARVVHPPNLGDANLRPPRFGPIHSNTSASGRSAKGRGSVRPIAPEDEPLMREFHGNISAQSVYFRYLPFSWH